MNQINDYGVNEFLSRRLNINDSPAPASTLAPEIMPVMLAALPSQEDDFLRGVRRNGATAGLSAVALNYSICVLENPAGSNILVMLDDIFVARGIDTSYAQQYVELMSTVPVVGTINSAIRDTRWGTPAGNRSMALFRAGSTVTAPSINWSVLTQADIAVGAMPQHYRPGIVLSPGYAWILYSAAVNQGLGCALYWRERPAQPSELG